MQTKAVTQTRVVISDRLRPIAEELQAVTGVSSLSDVVAMLLTKYAQHLKSSWIESGMQILSPKINTTVLQPVQLPQPVYEPQIQEPQYVQELQPEPEPEEPDPVIERLSPLIDTF
jgi:hypothetical protein